MSWDDGSHAKVKKVQITFDDVIYSIQVTYEGTALQSQLRGSVGPKPAEFTLDSDEYITALSAYAKTLSTQDVITALTFTTNKRTLGPYGNKSGYQISAPEATGKQIAGFLGTSGNVLNSIDVHYAPIPTGNGSGSGSGSGDGGNGSGSGSGSGDGGNGSGSGSGSGVQKLDAQGGTGGTAWDDGSNYDGVTKIYVRYGVGIQFVKFDYVKDGQTKQGAQHGEQGRGSTKEVVINHPDEYLVSVEGWYDSSNIIMGIQFKTNQKTSEYIGFDYEAGGTKFTLQVQDKKIIGFHGFAGTNLNSIGAYFVPLSSTPTPSTPVKKLKAEGGETAGTEWDDGHHDDVKKVYVGQGQDGISAVKFEYKNGSQVVFGVERGESTKLGFEEFELEADEYLTSVEGTYDRVYGVDGGVIVTMLIFKTNKNRTSGQMGLESSTRFVLKEEGYKITGFHGRAGKVINAIGVYLAPLSSIPGIPIIPSQSQKLEGSGSDGGNSWDDGAFDGVRKVSIGQAIDGIGAVKFVYEKGAQVVEKDEHGTSTKLGFEEFDLDYPNEYITAVDGTYDKIFGNSNAIINMLRFKTNKQTYGPFGLEAGTAFVLKKDGHKIVGFHGSAGDLLHKFGVHVLPISK